MVQNLGDLSKTDMKVYPTHECKSDCPFCMTDLRWKNKEVSCEEYLDNFRKAFETYFKGGGRKVLFTGGEPTERPEKLLGMLRIIQDYPLDLVVMYTNGVNLLNTFPEDNQDKTLMDSLVRAGLRNYNISVHHYDLKKRQELSKKPVCNLEKIVEIAKGLNAEIRLNCTLMKDYIGNSEEVRRYIEYAKDLEINDVYFRDLFHLENRERSCSHANEKKLQFTDDQRIDFDKLVSEIKNLKNMKFNETLSRHRGNGRTYIFDYLGTRISFGTLIVGTEKEDVVTYLNFQPDGCAYKDMNGPESRIPLL